MAIPKDHIVLLAQDLINELKLAQSDLQTAQAAYDGTQQALSDARSRLTSLNNIKQSLLSFPDVQQTLKDLGITLP